MGDNDPLDTQRYPPSPAAELAVCGFDGACEIGRGGFGVVYRCTQADLDRTVAVKVLTVELDQENLARFYREQQAMGRLTGHPNIVNILQVGTTDSGRPYIVMPYHSHDSLDAHIRRDGPLPLDHVLGLGVKMAGAVETAHRLGILHRDIKPGNILLTDYGEPELTDFGIAHIAGNFQTTTGVVTGSPAYTAPEVLAGEPASPPADIYALGATLFTALTGHAAFERRSGEQVLAQFLRITVNPAPDLHEHAIPGDVAAAITRAMSREPDQRPATAAELGDNLRTLQRRRHLPLDEMALPTEPDTSTTGRSEGPEKPAHQPFTSNPASTSSTTGQLPLQLTSFIGRRRELTETKNLLVRSRLVTLTGIGGVGKTRLAIQVAANAQRDYPDGVRLAELGELHEQSLLIETVARALGSRDQSARPVREVLIEFLGLKTLLLVLDNCEHLVDAVADLAETLLLSCPSLQILATSREPLGVGGEAVLRVPPLGVPDPAQAPTLRGLPKYDAVSLFAERAAAAVPGFTLTEANAETIAGICHRLDGLPLAIELAAARLRAISPQQILSRLTDQFALLTRGIRDAPTRQQTLRLCVDWSFELCTAREQLIWKRTAVFAGSFELDAAQQVCGNDMNPDELLDTVTSLIDKSILIREEHGTVVRFRMLGTLRAYGYDKLEQTSDLLDLRRRHLDWCEQLARAAETEWISERQLDWIARLKDEQPNLREALEFSTDNDPRTGRRMAAALFWFWLAQGLYNESRHWYEQLLPRRAGPPTLQTPTLEKTKALYCASAMAFAQGDLETGAALTDEVRTLPANVDDSHTRAFVALIDGMRALYEGDLTRAADRLETALAPFGERRERTVEIAVMYLLGMVYDLSGLTAQAAERHEQVLSITQQCGETVFRSYSLWAMGIAAWRRGDADRSIPHFEQSLELSRQIHSPRYAAACLEALAWIASEQREPKRAATLLGAAEQLAHSIGTSPVMYSKLIAYQQDCEQKTRIELGNAAFTAAHRTGEQLGFDAAITYALHEQPPDTSGTDTSARLTRRELQVADLIAEGLTNQAIADRLFISPRTAQGHVEHILTKLGYTSRTQIASWIAQQQPR